MMPQSRISGLERGGPFGRSTLRDLARAELHGAAPGTEFRFQASVESSPLDGRARIRRARVSTLFAATLLAVALWHFGGAGYGHAKAAVGQLLQRAWNGTGNSP